MSPEPTSAAQSMTPDMFPLSYQAKMIKAYPVIAQMNRDEFVYGTWAERDEAFARVLAAKNLRRTHEMFLASLERADV